MPNPPADRPSTGGMPTPWAPRGPSETGSAPAAGPSTHPVRTQPGPHPPRTQQFPGRAVPPSNPPGPWAPTTWSPGGFAPAPPTAPSGGGGNPPYPPGYGGPPGPTGPPRPATLPAPAAGERGGRLLSAMIGGIVGAVIAALVAGGLVIATDDEQTVVTGGPGSTAATLPPASSNGRLDIQEVLRVAQPAVVSIQTGSSSGPLGGGSAGTGFVIDREGHILTNNHVIEGADEIKVQFFDGTVVDAEMVGSFPDRDVAMIKVEASEVLRPATIGSSDALRVGDEVVAIGNALNLGGKPSVTTGIVSAKDRSIEAPGISLQDLIQTDAAINPGNSGGPLYNASGEVVGINTAKVPDASNIGFALAIDSIKPLIEELKEGRGEVNAEQAFLGVSSTAVNDPDLPPETLDRFGVTAAAGVFIVEVTADSGAARGGLQAGDVITDIDGTAITNPDEVATVIRAKKPGDSVTITYERMGGEATAEVTLGRR